MTEESAKGKLTLSGKSTLTLKNLNKSPAADGKKVVQVEVRKKRVINQTAQAAPKKEIDEATAQKLKLLAGRNPQRSAVETAGRTRQGSARKRRCRNC